MSALYRTVGALVSRRRHCRHHRRQPDTRSRPRPNRRRGQRMAYPGAVGAVGLLATLNKSRAPRLGRELPQRGHAPADANSGTSRTIRSYGCAKPGANGTSMARRGTQTACDSPRTQDRPPQGRTHNPTRRVSAPMSAPLTPATATDPCLRDVRGSVAGVERAPTPTWPKGPKIGRRRPRGTVPSDRD